MNKAFCFIYLTIAKKFFNKPKASLTTKEMEKQRVPENKSQHKELNFAIVQLERCRWLKAGLRSLQSTSHTEGLILELKIKLQKVLFHDFDEQNIKTEGQMISKYIQFRNC